MSSPKNSAKNYQSSPGHKIDEQTIGFFSFYIQATDIEARSLVSHSSKENALCRLVHSRSAHTSFKCQFSFYAHEKRYFVTCSIFTHHSYIHVKVCFCHNQFPIPRTQSDMTHSPQRDRTLRHANSNRPINFPVRATFHNTKLHIHLQPTRTSNFRPRRKHSTSSNCTKSIDTRKDALLQALQAQSDSQ